MRSVSTSQSVLIAAAILIGAAFVGGVLYQAKTPVLAEDLVTIQRLEASERHIYGSTRAPVTIVEFSDYECPFCARLHPDLKRIVDESDGQIAWEYRHLPLRIHPLAAPAAIVSECVAKHHGNDAFWEFTDNLFVNQSALTAEYITKAGKNLGLTEEQLERCKSDPQIAKLITNDSETATALGGSGTPFNIIIYPDNSYKVVSGAVPYEQWLPHITSYDE